MFLQNIEIQGQTEKLNLERMLTAPYFYRATLCWCGDGRNPVSVCLSVCVSVCHKSAFYGIEHGPDLQIILRFIIRLSEVFLKMDFRY